MDVGAINPANWRARLPLLQPMTQQEHGDQANQIRPEVPSSGLQTANREGRGGYQIMIGTNNGESQP